MYPRSFEYVAPSTVEEAVAVLAERPDAKVLAGGQSLLALMKLRLLSPGILVDIGRIPGLDQVRIDGTDLVIGSLVTHAVASRHPLIHTHAQALAEAAASVGDPQVRNRGTVAGSLAHADAIADEPGAALALGARVVAQSAAGTREIAAADLFVDTLTTSLEPDEVIVSVRIPTAGAGEASAYDKLGRRGGRHDYPVAGAAAWLAVDGGTVTAARVAITGAGSRPTLATASGEVLVGTTGAADEIAAAADRAAADVTVLEDLYGSASYKAHLVRVYARRALTAARARAA